MLMDEEEATQKLLKFITEYLESNKENFADAVNLATKFSIANSITYDSLFNLTLSCVSHECYSSAYIFAKTCVFLSLENTKKASAYLIAGLTSYLMGRLPEAEEQYKLALEADPKDASTHYNYGIILQQMDHLPEAEEQYTLAIKIDPKSPNDHGAYSLLLVSLGLERENDAIEEMEISSKLFNEKGDRTKEYLVLAWLYEELANKYYNIKRYQESGQYAQLSGDKYIEASEQAGEKSKGAFLTKGYMLKGRAYIRKLNLQTPCDVKNYEIIMNNIDAASKCYKKAAEVSPKDNQICDACSLSMRCLSEILNAMLGVTNQGKVPKLKSKIEVWKGNLAVCGNAYNESDKGKNFIQSLYKMIDCVENFKEYKKINTWEEKRNLKECIDDLSEIAKNIEGPLQKVFKDATEQMDYCKIKTLYSTETKPFLKKDLDTESNSNDSNKQIIASPSATNLKDKNRIFELLVENLLIAAIIGGIIATVIGGIILKKIFP